MIISKFIETKVSPSNFKRLESLGYQLEPLMTMKGISQTIQQKIEDLLPGSNAVVDCICDECQKEFTRKFCNDTRFCAFCVRSKKMKGNNFGTLNKGKPILCMRGNKHPRWNPNKTEYTKYATKVRHATNMLKHIWEHWPNADKLGLCGVSGAYQLDHKVSIRYGFYNQVPVKIIASIENLEIITWEANRAKHHKNSADLWDLLK